MHFLRQAVDLLGMNGCICLNGSVILLLQMVLIEMLKHVKDISNFIKISQTRSIPFEESVKS